MALKNTVQRFGLMAIIFHWGMAVLLIFLVVLGLYMTQLPISASKLKYYGWHKEYGILALMFVIVRFSWRLLNISPSLTVLSTREALLARCVHWGFYVFMFALPLTGWLVTSAAALPVSFFGWFLLPNLVAAHEEQRLLFSVIHKWLAYGLIGTFCLHVGAAFKHHFINKDDIMRRMIQS